MAGAVDEAHVPHQLEAARARRPQAREAVVLRRAAGDEARGPRALRVVALVDLRVGVT